MTTTDIYIPPNCYPLSDDKSKQQIRLGIQGFPGTGKNWAALGSPDGRQVGFTNCIVANLDRGLGAFQGCAHIHEIPFYKMYKPEELKDKIIEWLAREGPKFKENQTLVVDSLSALEQIYHSWYRANETLVAISAKTGKVNDFAEWNIKEAWFSELALHFKNIKCDVILLTHEIERADKPTTIGQPGTYTGKIRPLMTGKVGDSIIKEYTDWFRQHACKKPTDPKDETLAAFRMTKQEFKAMCDSFVGDTIYFWQTQGDDLFNAKASSLVNPPLYIPATFGAFSKYQRQTNKQTT